MPFHRRWAWCRIKYEAMNVQQFIATQQYSVMSIRRFSRNNYVPVWNSGKTPYYVAYRRSTSGTMGPNIAATLH